jgi:hypothetical protein
MHLLFNLSPKEKLHVNMEFRKGNAEPNPQAVGKHAKKVDDLYTETVCLGAWSKGFGFFLIPFP